MVDRYSNTIEVRKSDSGPLNRKQPLKVYDSFCTWCSP